MTSGMGRKSAGSSATKAASAAHWSVVAWPLAGALVALVALSLILWAANLAATARLRSSLAQARQALDAVPTPFPEIRNLSNRLDLVTAQRNALGGFMASTSGANYDWSSTFRALLDHDSQRIAIRSLFHNGALLSVSGLAIAREDVAAYADRLMRSGSFEQVTVQSMEDVNEPFPAAPPSTATSIPAPSTALPGAMLDRYEIDDFQPGSITPNEVQQRSFSPVGDIDQATFLGRAGQRYCILALPQSAGVDPVLDVFMDGATYSNDNCSSQTTPLVSCLCPTGTVGSSLAAMVELQVPATGDRTVQVRVRNQGSYGPDAWYVLSVSLRAQPATVAVGDVYEPDDAIPRALSLFEQQQHTCYPAGDVDRLSFAVRAGRTYEVRTYNLAPGVDTVLSVDVGGLSFTNDNVAPGDPASRVVFASPVDGQVTATITHRGQCGVDATYWVTAVEVTAPGTPSPVPPPPPPPSCNDPYEPDHTIDRLISPGEQQQRTFCPAGDVDRVRFTALAYHRYRIQTAGLAPAVDTVLQVTMSGTALANDDRAPGDPSSLLEIVNTSGVDQAVMASISNKGLFGPTRSYIIRVDDLGSESPDAYEPDLTTKRFISVGEVQRHNFFPGGDIDRLILAAKAGRRYAVVTCGNAYDPLLGGSCLPLAPGVDTVLVATGPVANCAPVGCQNDDAAPGTSHRGSRVEFDSPGNAEITLTIYNNGSFGPGQEYYVRADEVGVVPTAPAPTPTETAVASPTATETFTPVPSATFTPIPAPTETPTETPAPTETPTLTLTATATQTEVPSPTGASKMRDEPAKTRSPELEGAGKDSTLGGIVRRWGLQARERQGTTVVRFVLTCRLKETGP